MSSKGVTKRRVFQNAQQSVEVVIKAHSKNQSSARHYSQEKKFQRDCLLEKKLESMQKSHKNDGPRLPSNKARTLDYSQREEVDTTKQRDSQEDDYQRTGDLSNLTWRDVLEEYSTGSDMSLPMKNAKRGMNYNLDEKRKDETDKPSPVGACCFPDNIHKSNQSPQIPSPRSLPVPASNPVHSNKVFTPFGGSALKLLRNLRERICSNGDSGSLEIVKSLEAYFSNSDNGDANSNDSPKEICSERSNKMIEWQQRKITELEETIRQLKDLSSGLLSKYEKLKLRWKRKEESSLVSCDSHNTTKVSEDPSQGVKLTQHLRAERDSLLREVNRQRETILQLEMKLREKEVKKGYQNPSQSTLGYPPLVLPPSRAETADSAFTERTCESAGALVDQETEAERQKTTNRFSHSSSEEEERSNDHHCEKNYNDNIDIFKTLGGRIPLHQELLNYSISTPNVEVTDVSGFEQ